MLIQFTVENFRSFKDETTIDFSATDIKEYENRVVEIGEERLLTAVGIYGANASGKSNLYKAFKYMRRYVLNSFLYGGNEYEIRNRKTSIQNTFLFDENSKEKDSLFEVYFIEEDSKVTYQYGFCINRNIVSEEWLGMKENLKDEFKTIFYRNEAENKIDLSGIPSESIFNIKTSLEPETLIVSLGSKLKVDICKKITKWFSNTIVLDFADYMDLTIDLQTMPEGFVTDSDVRKDVLNYLSTFDKGIVGFEIEKINDITAKIFTVHKLNGSDDTVAIPLNEESSGTQKMFVLYRHIQNALKTGQVFFVDELNSKLHPLLFRNILISFLNPNINKKHAQIVFTSHDLWQIANNLLRKDEIWFVEKNEYQESSLYSLSDFKYYDNCFENYILGRYGAIPELSSIHFNNGEDGLDG